MRKFWAGFATAYLISALIAGNALGAVIPAMNVVGRIYSGLTWPITSTCIALKSDCDAVPPAEYAGWMFD